jgi:hypothetical protein
MSQIFFLSKRALLERVFRCGSDMSWLLDSVVSGVTSFFSGARENEKKEEKKKKKKRDFQDDDANNEAQLVATPPPRPVRARLDSESKTALSDSVFASMSKRDRNAVMLSLWENAHRRATRKYLTETQREELVRDVSDQCGLPDLTFRALSQRVGRIQQRGTFDRAPGSGRPRKFSEEHANAAKQAARAFGGEISRTGIYELVAEQLGSVNVNKRAQFLHWLSEMFKRRRIRCKPSLNDH